MNTSLTLKEKIVFGLDLKHQKGVEIGPLTTPIVKKDDSDVKYIDRASTAEIKEWYSGNDTVDNDKIVEIDHVWGKDTLAQATGKEEYFDYCIAAHVIEHVPNLIGWLKEISAILKDNGVASFSVPDRRYSFDILRQETILPDLIEPYISKATKPSLRNIFDHFSNYSEVDIVDTWSENVDLSTIKPLNSSSRILSVCEDALKNNKYIDSHCSVFTSKSFFTLLDSLSELGLLDFRIKRFFDVEYLNFEFVVQLEKLPSSLSRQEKRRLFTESMNKTQNHIVRVEFLSVPAGVAQVYYDCGKGFNEKDSVAQDFDLNLQKTTLEFELPPLSLQRIRFDPVKSRAAFKIHSIELETFGMSRYTVPPDTIQPGEQIKFSKTTKTSFWACSYRIAEDPHVFIDLPQHIKNAS